jgi:hypothetical protein
VGKEELMKRLTLRLFSRGGSSHASVFEIPFNEAAAIENRDGMAKVRIYFVFFIFGDFNMSPGFRCLQQNF